MKKIYVSLFALVFIIQLQAQQLSYSKVLYDSLHFGIQGTGLVKDFSNGYIIIGEKTNYPSGLVTKVDSLGNPAWANTFTHYHAGYPSVSLYHIILTADSNYAICGSVYDSLSQKYQGALFTLSRNGTYLWGKTFISTGNDISLISFSQTADSGYVLCGSQTISGVEHALVIKTDAAGNMRWQKTSDVSGGSSVATSLVQLPDSTYAITGVASYNSQNSFFLMKLDTGGNNLLTKQYYSIANPSAVMNSSSLLYKNNNLYILANNNNYSLVKTDLSGSVSWEVSYSGGGGGIYNESPYLNRKICTNLRTSADGGFYFLGGDFIKVDSAGTIQVVSTPYYFGSIDVVQSRDSGYFIIGNGPIMTTLLKNGSNNEPQIGVIKTDTGGNVLSGSSCIYNAGKFYGSDNFIASVSTSTAVTAGISQGNLVPQVQAIVVENRPGCVDFTGGIAAYEKQPVNVFPNPASTYVILQSHTELGAISLYNMIGEKVLQTNCNETNTQLDISKLQAGVYSILIQGTYYKLIKE